MKTGDILMESHGFEKNPAEHVLNCDMPPDCLCELHHAEPASEREGG